MGTRERWNGEAPEAACVEVVAQDSVVPNDGANDNGTSAARAFAFEIVDLVARNQLNIQGAEACLKATSKHYQHLLPDDCQIPSTWHRCKKSALDGHEPKYFTRDFCPVCDHLFDAEANDKVCPFMGCGSARFTRKGKAIRQAFYFDLEDKVRRMYGSVFTATQAAYGTARLAPTDTPQARELTDAWDGAILSSLHHENKDANKEDILYFAQSNDGVEVQKNISYTPITAKLLNLPVKLRGIETLVCFFLCLLASLFARERKRKRGREREREREKERER